MRNNDVALCTARSDKWRQLVNVKKITALNCVSRPSGCGWVILGKNKEETRVSDHESYTAKK